MRNTLLLFAILALGSSSVYADSFTSLGTFNGSEYLLSNEIQTWAVAQEMAVAEGGHLVAIGSDAENEFLYTQLGYEIVHIGFSDHDTEGSFAWANGETIYIDNTDGSNSEDNDFAVLNFWDGSWTLVNQWVQKRYIVEIPGGPIEPSLTVICPTDITVSIEAGTMGTVVDLPIPDATSNCGMIQIEQTAGTMSGSVFDLGTTTVSYLVNLECDDFILEETCTYTVTVNEFTANCAEAIEGFSSIGELNGHKYFLSNGILNWTAAQEAAIAQGGYLASIESEEENEFLKNEIGTSIVFIGLNDAAEEGTLAWADGSALSYDHFDGTNDEGIDYGVMNFWDGSWSMYNEFVHKRFIIEIDCGGTDPDPEPEPASLSIFCPEAWGAYLSEPTPVTWPEPTAEYTCSSETVSLNINQVSPYENGGIFGQGEYSIVYEITLRCGEGDNLEVISEYCDFPLTVDYDFFGAPEAHEIELPGRTRPVDDIDEGKIVIESIYPNPADANVNIEIASASEMVELIEVYNAFGKRVLSQNAQLHKGMNVISLDISNLQAGMFIVKTKNTFLKRSEKRFMKILDEFSSGK